MLALVKRFTNEASWRPRQAKDAPSYLTGTLATKMLEDFSEEFGEELIGQLTDELMPEFKARAKADHAKADQVRMARDVATMFDELKGPGRPPRRPSCRPGAASGGTGPGARRIGKGAAAMVAAVDQLRAASGEFIPESGGGAESC